MFSIGRYNQPSFDMANIQSKNMNATNKHINTHVNKNILVNVEQPAIFVENYILCLILQEKW